MSSNLIKDIQSVLVIDDHPLYCDALVLTLKNLIGIRRVKVALSLADAKRILSKRYRPDLIMLDLNLPDAMGLGGFKALKDKYPEIPVVVISATVSKSIIKASLAAGASGYIPKECSKEVLQTAFDEISQGHNFVPPTYVSHEKSEIEIESIQDISDKLSQLTPQQNKILRRMCEGRQNKNIAYELHLAEPTIKAHISAIFRKLGVNSRTQAVLLVKRIDSLQNEGNSD